MFCTIGLLSYRDLNYVSLATVSFATMTSFFLPTVDKTIYFHNETVALSEANESQPLRKLT